MDYSWASKDIDIYADEEMADLEKMESLLHASRSREDGSQYCYDISVSANTRAPDVFADIITDFEKAFGMIRGDASVVEGMLEEEIGKAEPLVEDYITVYPPSTRVLREAFERPDRDFSERLQMLDAMV
ncbi:MAG: hypothetical protein ABEJ07_02955 [Candidatus Nanohaloarchaea archaeon]